MSLPPRPSSDWPSEITPIAVAEMKDTVDFWEPEEGAVYDPETDDWTGGDPTFLFSTKARVQHFRSTVDAYDINQWSTQVNVRLQIPLEAPNGVIIRRGLVARVRVCERFPDVENFTLSVESAINSTHAALRTITCVSQLSVTPLLEVP